MISFHNAYTYQITIVHLKYPTILYFNKGEILKRKAKQGKGKQSWKVLFRKDGQEDLSM